MGFTAVNLANRDYDQSGFDTKQEAYKYIEALVCDTCLDDVRRGYIDYVYDGVEDREIIDCVIQTSCGAQWFVITDEEYESSGDDIQNIFIAAGLKPADEKTAATLSPEQKEKLAKKEKELQEEAKKAKPSE